MLGRFPSWLPLTPPALLAAAFLLALAFFDSTGAVPAASTIVPSADKANPGGWTNEVAAGCGTTSTTNACSSSIDEDIDTPGDSDFITSDGTPKSSEFVEFQLTDAPPDLVTLTQIEVRTRAARAVVDGKDAQVTVEVRLAGGALLATPVEHDLANTTVGADFSYTISALNLTLAEVNGLFVRVFGTNKGPAGPPESPVRVFTVNLDAIYDSSATPTPTPTPTPTAAPPPGLFGDVDCSGTIDAVDALKVLRHSAQLSVSQNEPPPCPDIEQPLSNGELQGDVDCSNGVNAVDALKLLRYSADLSVSQNEPPPCPDIGT